MTDKIKLTLEDLGVLMQTAERNGTTHAWQAVAMEWCGNAIDEIKHQQLCIRDLNGILNEKRAEIERLRADAERYRWLEEHCTSENDNGDKCLVFWCDFENYNDVDAAIDAARAALKETP